MPLVRPALARIVGFEVSLHAGEHAQKGFVFGGRETIEGGAEHGEGGGPEPILYFVQRGREIDAADAAVGGIGTAGDETLLLHPVDDAAERRHTE